MRRSVVPTPEQPRAADFTPAYVFLRTGTTWSQQAYLKASNTRVDGYFGWSVAISDHMLAVGAYGESGGTTGVNGNLQDMSAPSAGEAYIYR